MTIKTKRESVALTDFDFETLVGWGINLTADDGNGEVVTSLQVTKKDEQVNFLVGTAEYNKCDKIIRDDWEEISINDAEAIDVRNWLVKEYPFSKQELVDLMTEVAKNG